MWGSFPKCDGCAQLLGPSDGDADPFVALCRGGLWLGVANFRPRGALLFVGTYCGSFDRERLCFGSGPPNHPARHALLGALIAGPDPLGMAFWG